MSNPIEDLGKIMDERMKHTANTNKGIVAELGIINSNMSLSVASLSNAIPKGEYMISLHLQQATMELESSEVALETDDVRLTTEEAESHKHTISEHKHSIEEHNHTVTLPIKLRGLQVGDRVLVVWAGTEPIVADIIVSS